MRDFVIHPLAFLHLLAQIGGQHSGCGQIPQDDQASGVESFFRHQMLRECHTSEDCKAVLCTFERVDRRYSSQRLSWIGVEIYRASAFRGRADMPAYIQHHELDTAPVLCPGCIGLLPMYVRDVEPHWSMAKIDFIYECSDCGAEVRQTVKRPEPRH
jgi:hypothetical protein